MEKLLPEFQKIVDEYVSQYKGTSVIESFRAIAEDVAGRMQALALRRPEMSDGDKYELWGAVWSGKYTNERYESGSKVIDAIIAAYESRRFQPIKRAVYCRLFQKEGARVDCAVESDPQFLDGVESGFKWLGEIFEREI